MAFKINWLWAGILMGLFNVILLLNGKILGASTAYSTVAKDSVHALFPKFTLGEAYFRTIPSGLWFEVVLIIGVFFGARISYQLVKKDNQKRGLSINQNEQVLPSSRYILGFIGGVLFIFGARLAGGCTSGHVLSGIAQLAPSSMLFAIGMFASGYPVANYFYKRVGKL